MRPPFAAGTPLLRGTHLPRSDIACAVAERGVRGGEDAAGVLRVVPVRAEGDTALGVLDDGPVAQLHFALILRPLPLAGVPQHGDAGPHLRIAGRCERAAVHHQLAAGTNNDAGRETKESTVTKDNATQGVHHNSGTVQYAEICLPAYGKRAAFIYN